MPQINQVQPKNWTYQDWLRHYAQTNNAKGVERLTKDSECSGLVGDPRHQGSHCTCKY